MEIDNFLGIPIFRPEDVNDLMHRYYIVVASSREIYWDIRTQLNKMGFREFQQYIYWECFEKKIAVLWGNCHTSIVGFILRQSREFNKEYGLYPLPNVQTLAGRSEHVDRTLLLQCELFIHQPIRKDNVLGEEYASHVLLCHLRNSCKVIAVPNLFGLPKVFFPTVTVDYECRKIRGRALFPFKDNFIDDMFSKGHSVQHIVKMIKYGNILSKNEVNELLGDFLAKVEAREEDWDIKLLNFLKKNYRKNLLFYDIHHPTNVTLKKISWDLFRILNIRENIDWENIPQLDGMQTPIYGDIRNHLGLEFDNDMLMRKYSRATLTGKSITIDEYVEQYIKWNYYEMTTIHP